MSVNFHTVGNNYQFDTPSTGDAQNVQNKPVSEEYLSIIREFGLEDTAALRDAFADNPPGPVDMGNLQSLSTKLDGMSGSMADVFTVMLLLSQMAQKNRETSRELRDVQQQGQLTSMQTAADEIRKAADFALAAGIVSGVMQMASGGLTMAGGIKGLSDLKGLNANVDAPTTTTPPTGNRPRANAMSGNANSTGTGKTTSSDSATGSLGTDIKLEQIRAQGRAFEGAGQLAGGVGGIISSGLTRASEEHKAEEKEADIDAKEHEMLAEKESDFMQFNRDMIGKVAQIMKDLIQLNTESEKAAATI